MWLVPAAVNGYKFVLVSSFNEVLVDLLTHCDRSTEQWIESCVLNFTSKKFFREMWSIVNEAVQQLLMTCPYCWKVKSGNTKCNVREHVKTHRKTTLTSVNGYSATAETRADQEGTQSDPEWAT